MVKLRCPRCGGNLLYEDRYVPDRGRNKEALCLQCGYRNNRPYEGIIRSKRHFPRHNRRSRSRG